MKVGITVTSHRSKEIRPNGDVLLKTFLDSFRDSNFKYDYCIYISDNQSSIEFDYPSDLNIKVIHIEDQSILGLTGAWNLGLNYAYLDGCDLLWNFNDDIVLNESVNTFVDTILNIPNYELGIYGPLSNEGGNKAPNNSPGPKQGITLLDVKKESMANVPNGFSFAITKEVYSLYRYSDNNFFPINHKMNGGDGKWGGQEGYFSLISDDKLKFYLINECWLEHIKFKAWEVARDFYKK
jgi:hypothetical protein